MQSALRKYHRETRRPIYSAALILPFFIVYHVGTIVFRTTYINGADALIIRLLSALSVHSMFGSALLLVVCFLIWQLRSRDSWRIDKSRLALMFVESTVWAGVLLFLFGWLSTRWTFARPAGGGQGVLERLVLYCGAGIYEELLFRGFLLGGLWLFFTFVVKLRTGTAAVVSTLLAALIFSAFHYVGPYGDPFELNSFIHRALGGLYFSALFVTRGFGVTAASHAVYDVFVDILHTL